MQATSTHQADIARAGVQKPGRRQRIQGRTEQVGEQVGQVRRKDKSDKLVNKLEKSDISLRQSDVKKW